jgi:2-methylcitrate dehydratase
VKELIARTRIEADAELTALWPRSSGGGVIVRLRDGRELAKVYQFPPGHPRNRLSDGDIERKFFELSADVLSRARAQRIVDEVWKFETCLRLDELMGRMKADQKGGIA